jgi:hypothetical protein
MSTDNFDAQLRAALSGRADEQTVQSGIPGGLTQEQLNRLVRGLADQTKAYVERRIAVLEATIREQLKGRP